MIMKVIHKEKNRWKFDFWWLKTAHSFSFWEYFHPEMMWFWTLRVINDDTIAAWMGFPTHPHSNMEIITIPLSWDLAHKDSMWNSSIITTWEVQAMSAGSGILHSEFNPSETHKTSLFQIWIQTKKHDIDPQYNQKKFSKNGRNNEIQLLVSPDKNKDTVYINQDAYISRISLENKKEITYQKYRSDNGIYFLVISWEWIILWGQLESRDALWVVHTDNIKIESTSKKFDVLILEVPMK